MMLLEPFDYQYMQNAIWMSGLVGGGCGFLSAFLILKGWALIADALSHAIVPGVAVATILGLPIIGGAFASAILATAAMVLLSRDSGLKADAVIGVVFVGFFGLGLFLVSLFPLQVDVKTIMFGNILAIAPDDARQMVIVVGVSLVILTVKWRDLMLCFFDPPHARALGINPERYQMLFFLLLAACTVAAMQTVGAFLVIAMVITPGAAAFLLCQRFDRMIGLSVLIGATSGLVGAWISYFVDGATGGIIALLQALIFTLALIFSPGQGLLVRFRRTPTEPATAPHDRNPA